MEGVVEKLPVPWLNSWQLPARLGGTQAQQPRDMAVTAELTASWETVEAFCLPNSI